MKNKAIRVVLGVIGGVVLVLGIVLTGAGTVQGGDYFTTSSAPLQTDSAAMVTREIDVEGRRPTDPQNDPGDLARVRIQVRNVDSRTPVFVGIARRADVERYLGGVRHDEMKGFRLEPLRVEWQRHQGRASAPPPGDQGIWAASSRTTGPGAVVLEWDKSHGEWMAVVMNTMVRRGWICEPTWDCGSGSYSRSVSPC